MRKSKLISICVEDPSLQYSLAMIFTREGYQVVSEPQSPSADFWVFEEPIDLLVLDNSERWDDLWNQKLNRIRCQFANKPILILTTQFPSLATFDCEDFGLCKIIQKPANPAIILENARELLT